MARQAGERKRRRRSGTGPGLQGGGVPGGGAGTHQTPGETFAAVTAEALDPAVTEAGEETAEGMGAGEIADVAEGFRRQGEQRMAERRAAARHQDVRDAFVEEALAEGFRGIVVGMDDGSLRDVDDGET